MSTLLLLVIYLIFISLGLPDSMLGSTWPSISGSLNINESMQGIISIIVSFCTIISSFMTAKLLKMLKEGGVVTISIAFTVTGLVCFSYSTNLLYLCLSAIPLGLGAGAIDATLNNYVAINYKAIHLNWLHAFWGVGATISPFLISFFLTDMNGWRKGALCLAIIQSVIFFISLISIYLWKNVNKKIGERSDIDTKNYAKLGFFDSFRIKGVLFGILGFFSYIAVESLSSAWFSSMMVFDYGVSNDVATRWTSYFFLGIMLGRFISGIISLKIKDKNMIRIGEGILVIGIILLSFKFSVELMPFAISIIGLGCAPIYPAIIHSTPSKFTNELSPSVMSIQVGCAYFATFAISPLFGVLGKNVSWYFLPFVLLFFYIIMVISNEIVLIKTKDKTSLLSEKLKAKLK